MREITAEGRLKWLFHVVWYLNIRNNVQTDSCVLLDEGCCLLRCAIKRFLRHHMAELKAV